MEFDYYRKSELRRKVVAIITPENVEETLEFRNIGWNSSDKSTGKSLKLSKGSITDSAKGSKSRRPRIDLEGKEYPI